MIPACEDDTLLALDLEFTDFATFAFCLAYTQPNAPQKYTETAFSLEKEALIREGSLPGSGVRNGEDTQNRDSTT